MSYCTRWLAPLAFIATATLVRAHDASQSSTNIWLRPNQIEVELIMSRVPSRALVDNAPPVPVTDTNFESTYHELLQKSAPGLLEITVDGQKIAPNSVTVGLYEGTDLRFDYLFPRPAKGKLSFTATFLKRMDVGYVNSLGVNEGVHMIGMDNQTADHMTWELSPGAEQRTPTNLTTQPTQAKGGQMDVVIIDRAEGHVVNKNFFLNTVLVCLIMLLISIGVYMLLRSKHRSGPPT